MHSNLEPRAAFDRIAFLVRRDGPVATHARVVRTLAIYCDRVRDPKSHACDRSYEPLFEKSMREFQQWRAGDGGICETEPASSGVVRMPTRHIDDLLAQHLALGEMFARHQESLVDRRWAEAAERLVEYERYLRGHIEFEERHLLPHCRVGRLRWAREVYLAEHRRIEQLLRKAMDGLALARRSEMTAAAIIALLDGEKTLKHVVEHHHEREENGLFAELRGADWVNREAATAGGRNERHRLEG